MKRHLIIFALMSMFMMNVIKCNAQYDEFMQTMNQIRFTEMVKQVNEDLPMSLGALGSLVGLEVEDGYLHIIANVDENMLNIDALNAEPELLRNGLRQMVAYGGEGDMQYVFDELKKTGLGLKITYIGNDSGKRATASMSNAELKQNSTGNGDANELLNTQIKITNNQMPMDLGYGMQITKLERIGDYIIYFVEMDDVFFEVFGEMQDDLREELANGMNSDDRSIVLLKQLCKSVNCGIGYRIIARTSGESFDILFSSDEL